MHIKEVAVQQGYKTQLPAQNLYIKRSAKR